MGETGVEPVTSCMSRKRSNHLSYPPNNPTLFIILYFICLSSFKNIYSKLIFFFFQGLFIFLYNIKIKGGFKNCISTIKKCIFKNILSSLRWT